MRTSLAALLLVRGSATLFDRLSTFPFASEDTLRANATHTWRGIPALYLEPESPVFTEHAWAEGKFPGKGIRATVIVPAISAGAQLI